MSSMYRILTLTLLVVALLGALFAGRTYTIRSQSHAALVVGSVLPTQKNCVDISPETFPCYEDYYSAFVRTHGAGAAFNDLKARYAVSPFVRAQCHQLAHTIGHTASELYPTPSQAFAQGDSFCWSGYYHGVMEELVANRSQDPLPRVIATLCTDIPGKSAYSFDYYNCVHGLGHGVMTLLDGELFESLTICDTLSGPWERSACGGVFMENIMTETRTGESKYLKRDDLLYPCTTVSNDHKSQCFLMQTSHMLAASDYDWPRVFSLCGSIESPYQESCYQSIGRDASGYTISDRDKTVAICTLGSTTSARAECITGAVKDFVSYFHSDTQAYALCDLLAPSQKGPCRSTVAAYYASF